MRAAERLLGCHGLPGPLLKPTKAVFTKIFKEYGLPNRIRTDNGTPFAAATLGRLSQLSVWWIKLGILPELIQPGKPQQNGRHERMHKTLKDEVTKPPAYSPQGQQRKLNTFRREFNQLRPHEGLDMSKPGQIYVPSSRVMPVALGTPSWPRTHVPTSWAACPKPLRPRSRPIWRRCTRAARPWRSGSAVTT